MSKTNKQTSDYPKAAVCLKSYLRINIKRRHNVILAFFVILALCMSGLVMSGFRINAGAAGNRSEDKTEAATEETPGIGGVFVPEETTPEETLEPTEISYSVAEKSIPYKTISVPLESRYLGYRRVVSVGVEGEERVVYENVIKNGNIVSSRAVYSEISAPAIDETVEIGAANPGDSLGWYMWPVPNHVVTSGFGPRNITGGSKNHEGIDIDGKRGDPIAAADGGIVIRAGDINGYGNAIIIEHANGDTTLYGHCSKLLSSLGDSVSQGDIIAEMGDTGRATGVHLHFELKLSSGKKVNPIPYLKENDET